MTRKHIELSGSGVRLAADLWTSRGRRTPHRGLVVLLHGGGQTRHSWRVTGERLATLGWAAVTVDLRGHGDSQWAPDGEYGVSAYLADIHALVADLRRTWGDLPVALVGASLGGKAALLALGEDPALAQALVMVDIALTVETEGGERVKQFMTGAPDGFGSLREAADAIAAYNPYRKQSGSLEGLKKNLRERDGRWYWHWDPRTVVLSAEAADSALIHRRSRRAARGLGCPVLLVRGRKSDIVSDAGVSEMRDLIADLTVTDVSDVGHMVAGDDNDVFSERLLDFLDKAIPPAHAKEVG
jgi:pimeloyl-ACP methyl ester carboxylesterase